MAERHRRRGTARPWQARRPTASLPGPPPRPPTSATAGDRSAPLAPLALPLPVSCPSSSLPSCPMPLRSAVHQISSRTPRIAGALACFLRASAPPRFNPPASRLRTQLPAVPASFLFKTPHPVFQHRHPLRQRHVIVPQVRDDY